MSAIVTSSTTGAGVDLGREIERLFADIDAMDVDAFVAHLADDVAFTWGERATSHGRGEVRAGVLDFWSTIAAVDHRVLSWWEVEPGLTVIWFAVTYTRRDGGVVTVPNVDILRWREALVTEWQVVIDLAPVYAPATEPSEAAAV